MILRCKEKWDGVRYTEISAVSVIFYILENIFKSLNEKERGLSSKLWSGFKNMKGILEIG